MFQLKIFWLLLLIASSHSLFAFPCLFSHGLADTGAQSTRYVGSTATHERFLLTEQPLSFDYLDAGTGWRKYYKVHRSSLAQQNEVDLLETHYQKLCGTATDQHDMLIMGVSRGASVVINFVALKKPQHIRALVLEAPFDRAKNIMCSFLRKIPFGQRLAYYFLRLAFPHHNQKSNLHPEAVVGDIPLSLPLLLICSKEDTVIPASSTINLFNILKKTRHTDVYLLVTEHGRHAKILWGPDGEQYQAVTHAFFARYGLSHDIDWAARGDDLLDACRGAIT
jgi:pimeloyl-ACP methyl ester carboxylesterase